MPLVLEIEYRDTFNKIIKEKVLIEFETDVIFLVKNNKIDIVATSLSRISANVKKIAV